ncbi:CsbD family protein [Prosthecobacter sp.]|uniref:CsbD family protein n=1 Tax=Prosthecobacter sp. TaxID=1965333 RepID=UPI002AB88675|nr:CsbD family protein [Prosthecobacter sp.]MDZ4403573.1 CsbD family protein [Prosthecobacter sp.]
MTKLVFKGSWNEIKGKMKQKYAKLTDDDFLFTESKDDELLGRLQRKTEETKQKLRDYIASL